MHETRSWIFPASIHLVQTQTDLGAGHVLLTLHCDTEDDVGNKTSRMNSIELCEITGKESQFAAGQNDAIPHFIHSHIWITATLRLCLCCSGPKGMGRQLHAGLWPPSLQAVGVCVLFWAMLSLSYGALWECQTFSDVSLASCPQLVDKSYQSILNPRFVLRVNVYNKNVE